MFTLERDGVTVEADTVRKAERKLKAELARRDAASKMAHLRALANLGWLALHLEMPGHAASDAEMARRVTTEHGVLFTVRARDAEYRETTFGVYARPVRIWDRATGETVLVEVEDRYDGPAVYAVGVWDGQAALQAVPEHLTRALLASGGAL